MYILNIYFTSAVVYIQLLITYCSNYTIAVHVHKIAYIPMLGNISHFQHDILLYIHNCSLHTVVITPLRCTYVRRIVPKYTFSFNPFPQTFEDDFYPYYHNMYISISVCCYMLHTRMIKYTTV